MIPQKLLFENKTNQLLGTSYQLLASGFLLQFISFIFINSITPFRFDQMSLFLCRTSLGHVSTSVEGCRTSLGRVSTSVKGCRTSLGHVTTSVKGCRTSLGHVSTSVKGCRTSLGHVSTSVKGCRTSVEAKTTRFKSSFTPFNNPVWQNIRLREANTV